MGGDEAKVLCHETPIYRIQSINPPGGIMRFAYIKTCEVPTLRSNQTPPHYRSPVAKLVVTLHVRNMVKRTGLCSGSCRRLAVYLGSSSAAGCRHADQFNAQDYQYPTAN